MMCKTVGYVGIIESIYWDVAQIEILVQDEANMANSPR